MKENLRRAAQEVVRKFKFVLEEVGAEPGEETFWTRCTAGAPVPLDSTAVCPTDLITINQFLGKFPLEACEAINEVIRTEHADSQALMAFADKELADYIFIRQQGWPVS